MIWIVPILLYLISSQFSTVNTDSVRDYLAAYRIAVEGNLPLVGPQMAFTFHLGPLWFYILSIPLLLTKSWAFLSLFIAFLNALKFYLAYKVAQLLLTKEAALFFVSCLMLASLTIFQQLSFTHSNVIEVCVLIVVYYCLILDTEKPVHWLLLGLLFGVALHAHPTTAIAGYWVLLRLFGNKNIIRNSLVFLVGVVIVFSPILVYQLGSGFGDIKSTTTYFSHYTGNYDISTFFKMVYGSMFHSAYIVYKTLFPEIMAKILFGLHALFIGVVLIYGTIILIVESSPYKKRIAQLFGFFAFTVLFLFFIRNNTPWYMTYVFTLSFSLLLAALLFLINSKLHFRFLPLTVYLISVTLLCIMLISLAVKLNTSMRFSEFSMVNIRTLNSAQGNNKYEFSAHLAKRHGQLTCQSQPVSLNGPYGALIYSHSGIEHLSACGSDGLYYGYSEAISILFAVPGFFKDLIKKQPIKQIGNSYFYKPETIHRANKSNKERFLSDYDRSIDNIRNWRTTKKSARLKKGLYLVVTKQLGFHMDFKVNYVNVRGRELFPIAWYDYAYLYYCDFCDDKNSVLWEVNYSESVEGMTNIVSF